MVISVIVFGSCYQPTELKNVFRSTWHAPQTILSPTIDTSSQTQGAKCKCTHRDIHCFCFDCDLVLSYIRIAQRMRQGPTRRIFLHRYTFAHTLTCLAVITLISAQYTAHHKVPGRHAASAICELLIVPCVVFLISRDVIAQYFNYIFIWHLRAESAPPPRSFFACPWERWAR